MAKHIFVTGGVVSGLGKGITAASLGKLLKLMGIDDQPVFKRTRISNQKEQVDMVVAEAQWLDQETILKKLPNISPDEVQAIIDRLDEEDQNRMGSLMGAAAISAAIDSTDEGIDGEE